jgi:hypothetical protein
MKKILVAVLAVGAVGSAFAQPNVGVSIGINQPGVYGRVNIGNVPPPALIVQEPVVIQQRRYVREQPPVYLYVPPAHQQNWRSYCGRYNACSKPVYFVRDDWVRERYENEHPGWNNGRHRGWDKNQKHEDRDDHGDRGRGDNGKGHKGGRD